MSNWLMFYSDRLLKDQRSYEGFFIMKRSILNQYYYRMTLTYFIMNELFSIYNFTIYLALPREINLH